MFQQLKRLGTETAIYGISTILGRFLNFLLVPFYTNVLAPGDYGIVAYVYSLIAFVNVIYSYGMESAYFKYSSTLEIGTEKQNFSTPFISLFSTSLLFSVVITILSSPISGLIGVPFEYSSVVLYSACIVAFDAIAIIPFAALRLEHRAKLFATIKSLNIVVNVGMNLILLLVFKMGVVGVFISGLTASVLTVVLLLPTMFRYLTKEFNRSLWSALIRFGLPFIPSGLAAMVIQVIDRPILRALTDDATVGIYQANYRLGIFMMLIVSMYDYAWRPFYFSTAKEPNAKEIFARVLTYLVLLMSVIFLVLTFFIGDIAKYTIFGRHIIGPGYWSGLNIVPIILLGYVFLGVSTSISAGIYIEKKTRYAPLITGIGAIVNIVANVLLIPMFGMTGAAWATFFAYMFMALTMYFVVQRVYPVKYEFGRLLKISGTAGVLIALYYCIPVQIWVDSAIVIILWKIALIASFLMLLSLMRFFEAGELRYIKTLLRNRNKEKSATTKEFSCGSEDGQ